MIINSTEYTVVDVYDISITVPDSFVTPTNKTCKGNGEAKLYMGSKDHMRSFYAGNAANAGFSAKCMILKSDLLQYLETIHHEYLHPSIKYRGCKSHGNMGLLWDARFNKVRELPTEVILFDVNDQNQIAGDRGYVKTSVNPLSGGYGLIRELSLPFVSYISVMKLQDVNSGEIFFYWKLFTDFSQMAEQQYRAKHYGKKKAERKPARDGQTKYRQALFAQFRHCPFTQIDDISLLIASHIKPWAICNKEEKTDINNGIMLSPLFDKLFDKGYISFENDGTIKISNWLSPTNQARIDFSYDANDLHLGALRNSYLEYHRKYVFKS